MDDEQRRHLRAGMESVLNTVNTVFLATGNFKGGYIYVISHRTTKIDIFQHPLNEYVVNVRIENHQILGNHVLY